MDSKKSKKAIYLSGGGARGAYQAGVLKGIHDITQSTKVPVEIVSGVSAGSINAAFLAMYADNFPFAITKLIEIWSSLSCGKIFSTSNISLIKSVVRNVFSLVFHYNVKGGGYLLDTAPLKALLNANLDFKKINNNIEKGLITDFEITTTCYDLSETVSFFKSASSQSGWKSTRHASYLSDINCQHILASAAIPLFFPAIKIGQFHHGDGGMSLTTPLRGVINLEAERILVIGTSEISSIKPPENAIAPDVTFAKILGNMLDASFSDNLVRDIELLSKINDLVNFDKEKILKWRKIKTLFIYPSKTLGKLSEKKQKVLPILLRYLMTTFGTKGQSGDLLSFLLFEADYCKELIDIGYDDAMARKNDIEEFFMP